MSPVPLVSTGLAGLWVYTSEQDRVHQGDNVANTELCQPGCPSEKDSL